MTRELQTPGPTSGMSRYRADETDRVVTGWALHNHLVHDYWDVDRSRMDSAFGESPDVWAIIDEDGEERTLRQIADVPEDAADSDAESDGRGGVTCPPTLRGRGRGGGARGAARRCRGGRPPHADARPCRRCRGDARRRECI